MDDRDYSKRLEAGDVAHQFEAEMHMSDNPFNIGVKVNFDDQMMFVCQNGGENWIALPYPATLRVLAESLVSLAERWERGEIEGLKVPK
jgi:hypothetical protein